jgi:hypothetical protein
MAGFKPWDRRDIDDGRKTWKLFDMNLKWVRLHDVLARHRMLKAAGTEWSLSRRVRSGNRRQPRSNRLSYLLRTILCGAAPTT